MITYLFHYAGPAFVTHTSSLHLVATRPIHLIKGTHSPSLPRTQLIRLPFSIAITIHMSLFYAKAEVDDADKIPDCVDKALKVVAH